MDYHLKITMTGTRSDQLPPIMFEGSTDNLQLEIEFEIDFDGMHIMVYMCSGLLLSYPN